MVELVVRIGFSLVVVLGILWLLAKVARRPLAGRGGGTLAVLARQQLSRGASVAVIRVADRALVLGVTDGQVNLLGEAAVSAFETTHVRRESVDLTPGLLEPAGARTPADAAGRAAAGRSGDDIALVAAAAGPPRRGGRLDGSALSPQTWAQAVQFLRDRTAR